MESYGGIFTDRPFEFNMKCVLYGFSMMGFYWFAPKEKNYFMLPVIFVIGYILMGWYDYMYSCNAKMYSGNRGIISILDSPFKPQRRSDEKDYDRDVYLSKNQEKRYQQSVNLFHIIAVFPFLAYVGYMGHKSNKMAYSPLMWMGVLAGGYHFLRLFIPRETKTETE